MNRRFLFLLGLLLLGLSLRAPAQGTAFSYQGRLSDAGAPANGGYDIRFGIYDAVTNGTRFGPWLTNSAVPVSNGLFLVTLDFGTNIFNGTNWWLDLGVRKTNNVSFTGLFPRQPVLPVPYAIFAISASNVLGAVSAGQVSGVSTNPVTFTNVNNTFSGNGAGLTSLNGSQITTGTVADQRLSTNVALLNTNQTFTGTNIFTGNNQFTGANNFTNTGNRFTGSFFGNGNVGWDAFPGPTVQAEFNHGYLLTNSQFTTVMLPPTPAISDSTNIGFIVRISGGGVGGWMAGLNAGQSIFGNLASYRNSLLLPTGAGDWRRLASSADSTRMYAGANGSPGVFSSYDYGHLWNSTVVSGSGPFFVACSADGNVVYAAGNGGPLQRSLNTGLTWSSLTGNSNWTAVACSADGSNYIAGASSGALVRTKGISPANGNWTAVACSGDFTNLAASISSTVYYSTNAGASWSPSGINGTCNALAASVNGFKLVAAYNGGIAVSTNFGATWKTNAPAGGNWTALAASSDCSRIIAGVSNGLLYASANFGATWTALTSTNQFWSGAACSADGSIFAAATRTIGSINGDIFYSAGSSRAVATTNSIVGSQGCAVELQYLGNGRFMPISSAGTLWAN